MEPGPVPDGRAGDGRAEALGRCVGRCGDANGGTEAEGRVAAASIRMRLGDGAEAAAEAAGSASEALRLSPAATCASRLSDGEPCGWGWEPRTGVTLCTDEVDAEEAGVVGR
jgi:hypothetical protein